MLTKFAAALLATSLIAGSAIAAQPSGTTAPAAQSQSAPSAAATKAGKTVKHATRHRHHVRKHVARGNGHRSIVRHARHTKPATTHQAGLGTKRS